MISSKLELEQYLNADKNALKRNRKRPAFNDFIWKYEILLRKCEYYNNCSRSIVNKFLKYWYGYRRSLIGVKCGFFIPINTTGKGLCIAHIGTIIVSEHASIGDNCRIHVGVNIGADFRISNAAPKIGNNVYIGPGAKVIGGIKIGNNVAIGANAVVVHDVPDNAVVGGVPAKINNILW